MYKYKWFLPFILLLALYACSQNENPTLDTIEINPDVFVNIPGDGSEWIESIKFLPLRSDGEHFIPEDANIKFRDDYILMGNTDRILIFNKEGRYINELYKKGKGPEEYSFIGDYDLVPGSEEIVIIGNKKLLFYTLEGKFIEAVSIPFVKMSVAALSKDKFACMLGRERNSWAFDQPINYQFVIINRKGEIIDQRFEFPYSSVNFPSYNEIYPSADGNSKLFHLYFDYNVYAINPSGEINVKYTIDYGNFVSDTAFLQQPTMESESNIYPHINGRMGVSNKFCETSNTLYIQVGSDKHQKMTYQMVNRESGNQFTLVMGDDAVISRFHGWPLHSVWAATGDYFFQPLQAFDVIEKLDLLSVDQKEKLSKYPGFKELSTIQEDDEIILVLYKVKNF